MYTLRRSLLFIPGNNPAMVLKGHLFGADSIIYDLEDAVSIREKDAARILLRNILKEFKIKNVEKIIRINDLTTNFWKRDLDELIPVGIDTVLVPKTETAGDILKVENYIEDIYSKNDILKKVKILPLIESALGVENAFNIASSSKSINGLFLGAEDLTADIGAKRSKDGNEILYSRTRLIMAAKAVKIDAIDTPFTDINDIDGLRTDAENAKNLGFTGKSMISPMHIDPINKVFSPSVEEVNYSKRIIFAIEKAEKEGRGVISLDGKMIDAPIVIRAREILKIWKRLGGDN